MATVTLPREFAGRKNLVAVPRKSFEEFVEWQRKRKSRKTFTPTATEKKALAKARKNRARGNVLTFGFSRLKGETVNSRR